MKKYDKVKAQGTPYDSTISRVSEQYNVPYDLLHRLLYVESRFNPNAVSPTGPRGLGQFTKATGKAYGLLTPEDFFNPEKSIDASGRHLRDLLNQFNGDEAKAVLAYNQGAGKAGLAQIKAWEAGDTTKVSKEGLNYIKQLSPAFSGGNLKNFENTSSTPKRKDNQADGQITWSRENPTLPPNADKFIEASPKVKAGEGLPEPLNLQFDATTTGTTSQRVPTVGELENKKKPAFFEGTGDAIEGMYDLQLPQIRGRASKYFQGSDAVSALWGGKYARDYVYDDEDIQAIRDSGLPTSALKALAGANSKQDLKDLIAFAKENQEILKTVANTGTGAKIVGGIVSAGADPLTYLPIAGATQPMRLFNRSLLVGAQVGAINVAEEALRSKAVGTEADYTTAFAYGAAFGGGLTAILGGLQKILGKNDFTPEVVRMEARESSRVAGLEDSSKLLRIESNIKSLEDLNAPVPSKTLEGPSGSSPSPKGDDLPVQTRGVVEYQDLPNEVGAVRLSTGDIISDGNPINPKILKQWEEVDPERAARGLSLGRFSEIGYTTLRSENPVIREFARDLVRSPTGMESGTNGKFGMTAQDILTRNQSLNKADYNIMDRLTREALDEPELLQMRGTTLQRYDEVHRRVSVAIEDRSGTLRAQLTPKERELANLIDAHFKLKYEQLKNPAQFGNANAKSLLESSRFEGSYIPNVYENSIVNMYRGELGIEGLQEAIANSWLMSYKARPEVKARVDKYLQELNPTATEADLSSLANKLAKDKAYGIASNDQFTMAKVLEDADSTKLSANNRFLDSRNPFDSDMSTVLPNGEYFAVNDLRNFSLSRIMPAYDRRVDGDIALMGSTGKYTKDLIKQAEDIINMQPVGKAQKEAEALRDMLKIITGKARRTPEGVFDNLLRASTDMSFFGKNAFMGIQNLTEVAMMVSKGNVKAAFHGVPKLQEYLNRAKVMDADNLKEFNRIMNGRELDNTIRPRREDIIARLRENTGISKTAANILGSLKYGTQELSAWSPWTKTLTETTNYIVDAARQGTIMDVVQHAMRGDKTMFDSRMLKSASISDKQWDGIQNLIREYATENLATGKVTFERLDKMRSDPRSYDLWRLSDHMAHEAILRPQVLGSQSLVANNPLLDVALQFKMFTVRSINGKTIRAIHTATKNDRGIDIALAGIISMGISGLYYIASTHLKAQALNEKAREKYLDAALSPNMISYAALSRSNMIGSPLGLVNMVGAPLGFDQGAMVRSSILAKEPREKREDVALTYRDVIGGGSVADRFLDQIPAVQWAGSVAQVAYNGGKLTFGDNKDHENLELMTGLYNGMRNVVPNDPISQRIILGVFEEQGIKAK